MLLLFSPIDKDLRFDHKKKEVKKKWPGSIIPR
jgi:hypothetical protein